MVVRKLEEVLLLRELFFEQDQHPGVEQLPRVHLTDIARRQQEPVVQDEDMRVLVGYLCDFVGEYLADVSKNLPVRLRVPVVLDIGC